LAPNISGPVAERTGISVLVLVCLLTFVHYTSAQMRTLVLPLYASAHGATATWVGLIMGLHMAMAAIGSIPLGRASDIWGRRPLLLGGMAVGVVTSLLLPLVESGFLLAMVFGIAGLGVAAFTPSALSLVGDAATPPAAGRAYAWYSTAHYGAIAIGPFLGGLAAQRWGYRAAFLVSSLGIAIALVAGFALPARFAPHVGSMPRGTFADVRKNASVWAGWIAAAGGMFIQGVVFTFLPLLAHERGLSAAAIGFAFLILGLANTVARFPAGWLMDRTGRRSAYAVGGLLVASVATGLLPAVGDRTGMLALVAAFGAVSGAAFVAISVALAGSTTPATRGLVMGGYSTAMYLGLALGSFALGPVITGHGFTVGFTVGGAAGVIGALATAALCATGSLHVTIGRVSAAPPACGHEETHGA
jgi:MFS family permease